MAILTACWRGGGDLNKSPGYILKFEYDGELVERLKKAVPHTHREWHEPKTEWWVEEGFEAELEAMFTNFHALAFDQMRLW